MTVTNLGGGNIAGAVLPVGHNTVSGGVWGAETGAEQRLLTTFFLSRSLAEQAHKTLQCLLQEKQIQRPQASVPTLRRLNEITSRQQQTEQTFARPATKQKAETLKG